MEILKMSWLKKLFNLDKKKDNSNVGIGEEVIITLKKDNEIIDVLRGKGHTWQGNGCIELAKWIAGTTTQSPRSLACNGIDGSTGSIITATRSTSTSIAILAGTFLTTTTLNNITEIHIKDNGTIYAIKSYTAFNKPSGTEMGVEYRSTISGV